MHQLSRQRTEISFITLLVLLVSLSDAGAARSFNYMSGDVISQPQIVAVYWGNQNAGIEAGMNQFYSQLVSSPYLNGLREYATPSKNIGSASFSGGFAIRQGEAGTTVDTVEIARELDRQISSGALPYPNENTIYLVHLGEWMDSVMGSNIFGAAVGVPPGAPYCAYHFTARIQIPTPVPFLSIFGPKIRIAVIPDQGMIGTPCGSVGVAAFDSTTTAASHELVETITDPDSVVLEMPPVIGANIQCNGVRLPVTALTPITTVPPAYNDPALWAWTSPGSEFCHPDEIADGCLGTSYAPAGNSVVSPYAIPSQGDCALPGSPPPAKPGDPHQMCLDECAAELESCMADAHSGTQRGMCVRQGTLCRAGC